MKHIRQLSLQSVGKITLDHILISNKLSPHCQASHIQTKERSLLEKFITQSWPPPCIKSFTDLNLFGENSFLEFLLVTCIAECEGSLELDLIIALLLNSLFACSNVLVSSPCQPFQSLAPKLCLPGFFLSNQIFT